MIEDYDGHGLGAYDLMIAKYGDRMSEEEIEEALFDGATRYNRMMGMVILNINMYQSGVTPTLICNMTTAGQYASFLAEVNKILDNVKGRK
jgi:hypothetical protein